MAIRAEQRPLSPQPVAEAGGLGPVREGDGAAPPGNVHPGSDERVHHVAAGVGRGRGQGGPGGSDRGPGHGPAATGAAIGDRQVRVPEDLHAPGAAVRPGRQGVPGTAHHAFAADRNLDSRRSCER